MGIDTLNRAVFLDRDGVLNANVLNPMNAKWESPHRVQDFRIHEGVPEALRELQKAGFLLIVVTNQPDVAKGKATLETIQTMEAKLTSALKDEGISLARYCCCLHHPEGINPEYTKTCECRKPSPFFLLEAARDFKIDLSQSWMIGDRANDIACGKNAGTKTILLKPDHPDEDLPQCGADFVADDLAGAVRIVKGFKNRSPQNARHPGESRDPE